MKDSTKMANKSRDRKELSIANAANRVIKIKRRRSRYEKPIHAIWELFSDYSAISTIHGIRYLGEKQRHWFERVWWMFAFSLSVMACGIFIYQAAAKWNNTPVIVTFAEESTPVAEIPFPAVTICTDTKVKQRAMNYTRVFRSLKNLDKENSILNDRDLDLALSATHICKKRIRRPPNLLNTEMRDIYKDLRYMSPSLRETFLKCSWTNNETKTKCSSYFHETLTDEGVCFTFNALHADDIYVKNRLARNFPTLKVNHTRLSNYWSKEERKKKKSSEKRIYPRRVLSASDGFVITLRMFVNDTDYVCGGPVQSFKVLLHTAGEIPQMTKYFYRVPLDHDIIMAVRPNIMTTTDSLKDSYTAKKRKCYFDNEKPLQFFKYYTQRNCQLDCIATRMASLCKCAKFTMLRSNDTPICDIDQFDCVDRIESDDIKLNESLADCGCLPACESITYDAELSMAKYDHIAHMRATGNYTKDFETRKYVRLFISFKDDQFITSRRSQLYGVTDFIANCGGIMGLFMGVSLLSIVEIVYFSTLRLGCNLRKRHLLKKQRLKLLQDLDMSPEAEQPPSVKMSFIDASRNKSETEDYPENRF